MNDAQDATENELPAWVVERLTEAFHRVQNMVAGRKLWQERFTAADHARFSESWPEVWEKNQGTIGLWCRARGTPWNRGIAEVAHVLGFLDQSTRDAILAALPKEQGAVPGSSATRSHRDVRPSWNKALGELRYRGDIVREVKPEAEHLRLILDAFQTDGWPNEIYDPFPADDTSRQRGKAVANLNKHLQGIRFFSAGKGRRIGWKPVDASDR
jgi:hypothetical protein